MNNRFEVHSHDETSNIRLIDCINKPKNLIKRAVELGLKGIAITNHECLSSAVSYDKIQKELTESGSDFKIALGNEIYLTETRDKGQKYYHFILIAKDKVGFKQLRKLSSKAWLNSYADRGLERVPTLKSELKAAIENNPGHLIATTACLGGELSTKVLEMENARHIGDNETADTKKAELIQFIFWCKELFGDDFYIECAPGKSKEQVIVNKKLVEIAAAMNVKMVIGCDAHFLKKEDRYVHKAYLNSKDGEREVDSFYEFSYLQSEEEIIENLTPSIVESYEVMCHNSMEIYDKLESYSLAHPQQIPKVEVYDYPKNTWWENSIEDYSLMSKYPVLKSMFVSDDKVERYWVNQCWDSLHKKVGEWKEHEKYVARLEEEADVKRIISGKLHTNMFSYPVTLQHYIDLFWECGSTVGAGRGSSCAGLNHYLLDVTQLDPLKWELPFWRYLNSERIELGDIDIDICPSKRPLILQKIKEERGANFIEEIDEDGRKNLGCSLIATFGTESTKSAILTACRGYRSEEYPDGIDVDTAQYLSSLIPSERGFVWSLKEVVYGDAEKGRQPVTTFINEVSSYPGLLDIMMGIEGLISRRGSHASGVIMFDEDPYEFGCFMKTPSGDIITQYDLHDAEYCGMTKYDFLVTEVQDKLTQAIQFLQEFNEIENDLSLKEVYDKYFHPNVLDIENKKTWKAIQQGQVLDLFQFDSLVGAQAAKKIQPKNMNELADANGLMRLMTSEKGEETPMDKYVRFKNDNNLWIAEMQKYGLTEEEQQSLMPYYSQSYGVPPSQEQMMKYLMDENICNFTLAEANAARKVVAKKQMSKIPELKEKVMTQAKSENLGKYIWDCGVCYQLGYAFSIIHALAYSFIGFQTANIATRWSPIYWNTACLVVNSGSLEANEDEAELKKKDKNADYGKIAKAIGDIRSKGAKVSLIDINHSDYGFRPNPESNSILYGMKALSGINTEIIEKIKAGRPYYSIKDFVIRCPLGKTAMINLIKSGAFDNLEGNKNWDRKKIMAYYLYHVSEPKEKLTLQNFNGLLKADLVPQSLEMQVRIFNFNKYLKAYKKVGKYYMFDDSCMLFFNNFLIDKADELEVINGVVCILQTKWDKIYQLYMDEVRLWLKENQEEVLNSYNLYLFKEIWNKYAQGSVSHWEMEALCFYYHDHELSKVNMNRYGISDFNCLSRDPVITQYFKRGQNNIPLYKLERIAGTVIAKNDTRFIVTLLTTTGVVNVKFTREYYAMFKKQISQINPDGTKSIMERGWFTRGNMLMVTGYRREDTFVGKTYKSANTHQLYKIVDVKDDDIMLQHERFTANNTVEEDEYETY